MPRRRKDYRYRVVGFGAVQALGFPASERWEPTLGEAIRVALDGEDAGDFAWATIYDEETGLLAYDVYRDPEKDRPTVYARLSTEDAQRAGVKYLKRK